jgi:hypothetical protein
VFSALKLGAPISVRSEGVAPNQWNWAIDSHIKYVFPGTAFTAGPTVEVTWYDGAQKPPSEIRALTEGDELPREGSLFVGTLGAMALPHWDRPLLYPDKRFADFKYPEVSSGDHWDEFVQACRGGGKTSTSFDYAGPLTEAVLLGSVACRFPKTTLKWDAASLAFDLPAANQFVRRDYRDGWHIKGLC